MANWGHIVFNDINKSTKEWTEMECIQPSNSARATLNLWYQSGITLYLKFHISYSLGI